MDILTREEFEELAGARGAGQVSIYLPTHRSGEAVNEKIDWIAFKNALQTARKMLSDSGAKADEVDRILEPGNGLLKNEDFWNNQAEGLAVFIGNEFFRALRLPYPVREQVLISSNFQIGPLICMLTGNKNFYLLQISKNDARFFQGDIFGLKEVEVPGLPEGMADVVHFEEKEDLKLFRQGSRGGPAVRISTVTVRDSWRKRIASHYT